MTRTSGTCEAVSVREWHITFYEGVPVRVEWVTWNGVEDFLEPEKVRC